MLGATRFHACWHRRRRRPRCTRYPSRAPRQRHHPLPLSPDAPSRFPVPPRTSGNGHARRPERAHPPPVLPPAQSAVVRDRLLVAVADLQSSEPAAVWARDALAAKNILTASDAKIVEDAFEHKLSEFSQSATTEERPDADVVGSQSAAIQQGGSRVLSTANNLRGSTRARSRSARHGAIATRSICNLSPSSRACYAPANRPIRTISGSCSRVRWAARRATRRACRCAADIIGQRIARATNEPGGRQPGSTRSKSLVSFGHARGAVIPG